MAGFGEPLPLFPELDGYLAEPLPYAEVRAAVERRVVLRSDPDPLVPAEIGARFDQALGAEVIAVADAGHFSDRDGVLALSALAAAIRALA